MLYFDIEGRSFFIEKAMDSAAFARTAFCRLPEIGRTCAHAESDAPYGDSYG